MELKLKYKIQPSPDGLAQAFILGENFIGKDDVCLILGDNFFMAVNLPKNLKVRLKMLKRNKNCKNIWLLC